MKKTNTTLLFLLLISCVLFAQPDYKLVAPFFKKYISDEGQLNYKSLKKNKLALDKTLKYLTDMPPTNEWHRNERLAYWLNVYNLQMISILIENYPVNNILDLYEGKIWKVKNLTVGGKTYCLDDIENDIIRKELQEPRIHFALYSGAMSSPDLLNDAFTPSNMNRNFELLTKRFINSDKNNITKEKATLSMVFDWYKDDFKDIVTFINKYSKVKIEGNTEITFLEFDWRLKDKSIEVISIPSVPPVTH